MQILHITLLGKFSFLEDIPDVLGDNRAVSSEQLAHLLLREPDGLAISLDGHFQTGIALIDEDVGLCCCG